MKLLQHNIENITVPMKVMARHGDWVMAQYFDSILGEVYIFNIRTKKLFRGYIEVDNDDLYWDWQELTGQLKEELYG